ncbi:MAG: hypothetical protein P1U88_12850 [Thalassobaculaceae bacterium]|nr:hypothetical protein [Thalassobaculaceae bacterium]
MLRRTPFLVVGLLIVAAAALAITQFAGRDGAESRWSSDYGPLTLNVTQDGTVSGTYPEFDGRIIGTFHPELVQISGFWLQDASDLPCAEERGGTAAWGRVSFELVGSERLLGVWSYCDRELDGRQAWNADFLDGIHPREIRWR